MKKTIAAIVILFAVWFAWSAWPFLALYDLARAAQAADVAAIERGVDFPALRRSISSQIIQAYARGRRTKNLYHDDYTKEQVLKTTVGELKSLLLLDKVNKVTSASFSDLFHLGMFLVCGGLYSIVSVVQIPLLLLYNVWYAWRRRFPRVATRG